MPTETTFEHRGRSFSARAVLPKTRAFRLGFGQGVDDAVLALVRDPSRTTNDRVFKELNSWDERARTTGVSEKYSRGNVKSLLALFIDRYAVLSSTLEHAVKKLKKNESREARAALLVNLSKRFWGPIGVHDEYTSGVNRNDIKSHRTHFERLAHVVQSMQEFERSYGMFDAIRKGQPPYRCVATILNKELPEIQTRGNQMEYFNLLTPQEKVQTLLQCTTARTQGCAAERWSDDCLEYITRSDVERKALMQLVGVDPRARRGMQSLQHELGECVKRFKDSIADIQRTFMNRPDVRMELWLQLHANRKSSGETWNNSKNIATGDQSAFDKLLHACMACRAEARSVLGRIQRITQAQAKGNIRAPLEQEDEDLPASGHSIWNERKELDSLLTESEKIAELRKRFSTLLDDNSYEGAKALRNLLTLIAPTQEQRKRIMRSIFPTHRLHSIVADLKRDHEECAQAVTRYQAYGKELTKRLESYASIFPGGRASWGFQNGADYEDIVDERNFSRDLGDRNRRANTAKIRYDSFAGTVNHGEPWGEA